MSVTIIQAEKKDAENVAEILQEAANWLIERGEKLWDVEQLTQEKLLPEIEAGNFWLAVIDNETAGCLRYQESDEEYWGDVPHSDSAFIHKLSVKRKFAGRGISSLLMNFAKAKAQSEGKKYLRLDCAIRPRLQSVYEKQGFVFHSIKQRKPYPVARYEFRLPENQNL